MRGLRLGIQGLGSGVQAGTPLAPLPAITSILVPSAAVTAQTTSVSSGAFNPTAGAVLFAGVASRASNAMGGATTISDNTGGALTWSLVKETYVNDGVAPRLRGAVFKCVVPETPPTGVVLTAGQAQALYINLLMLEMIGGSPIISNIAPDAIDLTAGDPAATLPIAPASNDGAIFFAVGQGNSGGTAPAGSTPLSDVGNTGSLRSRWSIYTTAAPQTAQWMSGNLKSAGIYFAVSPVG